MDATTPKKMPLLTVVGPTASGKSALAVELALRFDGEVISADSMQIYRGMDIGTAKPTAAEMKGIPHHLIDCVDAGEAFSVADYTSLARRCIADVYARGKLPILAGGTGLYVNSLVNNVEFSPIRQSPPLRAELRKLAQERGNEHLVELLRKFDPQSAEKLHPNNLGRIIRAIEVYRLTGVTMTEYVRRSRLVPSPYNLCMLGLTTTTRQRLYDRINHRVSVMIELGLVKEARRLREEGLSDTAVQAIGYKELVGFLEGRESLESCAERIRQETRRYAKRQLTWFRRDERITWLEVDRYHTMADLVIEAEKAMVCQGFLCYNKKK